MPIATSRSGSHSCGDAPVDDCTTPELDDALMRAFIHDDGRGAPLGVHDKRAICVLYPRENLSEAACAAL
jgi:hypothetical protein